jgi:hypothetical protein
MPILSIKIYVLSLCVMLFSYYVRQINLELLHFVGVVHLVRSSRSYAHIIYQNICVKLVCDVIFLLREAD